tara:strand:- start:62 stop:307 length:246 start_codon:yes stop_codon:yes gene_type:complete
MTKITEEEIKKVNDLKLKVNQLINTVGQIEIQIFNLQRQKEELQMSLLKIQEEEVTIANELEKKYGKGTISLDTGEFSPNK